MGVWACGHVGVCVWTCGLGHVGAGVVEGGEWQGRWWEIVVVVVVVVVVVTVVVVVRLVMVMAVVVVVVVMIVVVVVLAVVVVIVMVWMMGVITGGVRPVDPLTHLLPQLILSIRRILPRAPLEQQQRVGTERI